MTFFAQIHHLNLKKEEGMRGDVVKFLTEMTTLFRNLTIWTWMCPYSSVNYQVTSKTILKLTQKRFSVLCSILNYFCFHSFFSSFLEFMIKLPFEIIHQYKINRLCIMSWEDGVLAIFNAWWQLMRHFKILILCGMYFICIAKELMGVWWDGKFILKIEDNNCFVLQFLLKKTASTTLFWTHSRTLIAILMNVVFMPNS